MLDAVEWGEFALGDLFEIKSNPQLDKGHFVFSENGQYPYFTRTVFNNGILGKVEYLDDEHKIRGGCLAVGMIAMQFFYMEKDFYAGQFTKRAIPKGFVLTPRLANYFITVLNKKQKIFQAALVRNFEKAFKTEKVQLPIKNGHLDLDFMENFVAELEAYLSAAGLKDYALSVEEEQALARLENGQVAFAPFKVIDLFNVKNTANILAGDISDGSGSTPYLSAGRGNNAVSAYISYDEKFLEEGDCIFIGGKTFVLTYQPKDFFSNDSHNLCLYFKEKAKLDRLQYFALIACLEKSLGHKYSWGDSISKTKIQSDTVFLPVTAANDVPDYAYMQTLLSAVQKRVIKSVVQYADQKIAATAAVRQQR